MAELTIEQQRAVVLARARRRRMEQAPAEDTAAIRTPAKGIDDPTRGMSAAQLLPVSIQDTFSELRGMGGRVLKGGAEMLGRFDANPVGTLVEAGAGLLGTPGRVYDALSKFGSSAGSGDSQGMAKGTAAFVEEIPNVVGLKAGVPMPGRAALKATLPARESLAGGLRTSAQRSIKQVLNPTTKGNKVLADKVAPRLAESGPVAMTLKGYEAKIKAQRSATGEALGEAHAKVPTSKVVETKAVTDAIEQSKWDAEAIIEGKDGPVIVEPDIVAAADKLKSIIEEFGTEVSYQSMVKLRQRWDKTVNKAKGFVQQDVGAAIDMKREAATAIREELARAAPDVAKINAEYSFWAKSGQVISDTVQRKIGQATPMGEQMATAAGFGGGLATGGLSTAVTGALVIRGLTKIFRSTGWRTASARIKSKLADAIAAGDEAAIESIAAEITPPAPPPAAPQETTVVGVKPTLADQFKAQGAKMTQPAVERRAQPRPINEQMAAEQVRQDAARAKAAETRVVVPRPEKGPRVETMQRAPTGEALDWQMKAAYDAKNISVETPAYIVSKSSGEIVTQFKTLKEAVDYMDANPGSYSAIQKRALTMAEAKAQFEGRKKP